MGSYIPRLTVIHYQPTLCVDPTLFVGRPVPNYQGWNQPPRAPRKAK